LYQLFAPFGKIIDIVCVRTVKHRGFAHVVFSDINAATAALRQLQGFPIYGKPIRIAFAKSESNAFLIAQGKPVSRKRMREDDADEPESRIESETAMEVAERNE
jgi:RNA recognition motif-containing protein